MADGMRVYYPAITLGHCCIPSSLTTDFTARFIVRNEVVALDNCFPVLLMNFIATVQTKHCQGSFYSTGTYSTRFARCFVNGINEFELWL